MYGQSSSRTLWSTGDGFFMTRTIDTYEVSPIYGTVAAARKLIRQGVRVDLPDGYDVETLDGIAWLTGSYGTTVPISPRQARGVAQIALTLMNQHEDGLDFVQIGFVRRVIQIVGTDSAGQ